MYVRAGAAAEDAAAREQEGEEDAAATVQQQPQPPRAKRALLSGQHFGARPGGARQPSPRILPAWV